MNYFHISDLAVQNSVIYSIKPAWSLYTAEMLFNALFTLDYERCLQGI